MTRGPAVVLGGGVAGLAAGYYLARQGWPVTVVEQGPVTGGLCGSFESHGFTLDYGPHKLYSVVPGILDEIRALMGDGLLEHKKKNRIRLLDRFLNYPLALGNLLPLLGPWRALQLGAGYASAMAGGLLGRREAHSYQDYLLHRFGRGVYQLVFEPLARKVWGDPELLSPDLAQARIPSGGAAELILRLLKLKKPTEDLDAPFFYYPKGGFGRFPEKLGREIVRLGGRVLTSAPPLSLDRQGSRVTAVQVKTAGGVERLACETLISSIPIGSLSGLLHPGDPEAEVDAKRLQLRNLMLVFLVIREDRLLEDHWIFFPEAKYPFNRLFEQKAMDASLGPAGQTALCCDITCDEGDEKWTASDDALVQRCLDGVVEAGLLSRDRFQAGFVRRFRSFYPMYTVDYRQRVSRVYDRLRSASNLVLTGRLGMFNYNNSDHCLDMGRFIAHELAGGRHPGDIWSALEARVQSYRIID